MWPLFQLLQWPYFQLLYTENGVLVKYNYNNGNIAADPKLASMNFLNALERIPQLIENHQAKGEKLASDIPILQKTAAGVWKKEDELKDLKSEVAALERKIALSLKPIEQGDNSQEQGKDEKQGQENQRPDTPTIAPASEEKSAGARMKM